MATRTITTKLALDGETEYKAKLQSVNAEIRVHQSELERVRAEYAGQLNSLEALQAQEAALGEQLEAVGRKYDEQAAMLEKAQEAQELYRVKAAALQRQLDIMAHSAGDTTEAEAELTKKLNEATTNMQRAANSALDYQKKLNYTARDQAVLGAELERTRVHLTEAQGNVDGLALSIDGYGKAVKTAASETENIEEALQQTGDTAEDMGNRSSDAVGALAAALATAGIGKAFQETVEAIKACIDASVEFESAMAGVQKVTKMSDEDLSAMGEGIKQMATEIPATTTEIAAVAEASARLEIAREDILSFTRVMLDLGESSNMSADEAATALARFANIAGAQAGDYERLGSTIVALGNSFATSEAEITAMASRLASAGTLAGLTEAEIMALAAAMSSVGIEAEAGGTAMTQTLTAMEKAVTEGGEKLEAFARIAGMSSGEFATAWQAEPIAAIQAFIAGLGGLDEAGDSATAALDELGLSGVRQSNMLKSLGLASETLAGTVETANTAWAENTELAATAAARYETTEAKLAMMQNAFENVKIAVGDVLAPALRAAAEAGTNAFNWAAEFIEKNPAVVSALAAVTAGIGGLAAAITVYTVAVDVVIPLIKSFNAALAAHPAGAVAAGNAVLVAAMGSFIATLPEASEETRELTASLEESRRAYEETGKAIEKESGDVLAMADALETLAAVENKSAAQKAAMADLVAELNEAVPGLTLAYDQEADSLNMTGEAIRNVARAEAERQLRQADYERLVELYRQQAATARDLAAAKERLGAAEAELSAMIEAGTYGAMGYEMATSATEQAVVQEKNSVKELTAA